MKEPVVTARPDQIARRGKRNRSADKGPIKTWAEPRAALLLEQRAGGRVDVRANMRLCLSNDLPGVSPTPEETGVVGLIAFPGRRTAHGLAPHEAASRHWMPLGTRFLGALCCFFRWASPENLVPLGD